MNNSIHAARYVRKHDTQLIGSFISHPGPVGEFRSGKPLFYFSSLPTIKVVVISMYVIQIKKYTTVESKHLVRKVVIFTFAISSYFPECMLHSIDGLVIAG